MEIYTCNVDGSNLKQITNLGNANWSPFFFIQLIKKLYFVLTITKIGFPFNLYMIDTNGKNLEVKYHLIKHLILSLYFLIMEKKLYFSQTETMEVQEKQIFLVDWVE